MLRYLPVLLELGLLVYCLVDCVQADADRVRNLPKVVWVFLIVLLPLVGGIAWLVAGRPESMQRRAAPWPSTRTAGFPEYERPRRAVAPDDDPEFLASMRRSDDDHERMLRDWERSLREREARLGDQPEPEADERRDG